MPEAIVNQTQIQAMITSAYQPEENEKYQNDLDILKNFIQQQTGGEKLNEKTLTATILALPDLVEGDTKSFTHYQNTARHIHSYAKAINEFKQANNSSLIESSPQNGSNQDGVHLKKAIQEGLKNALTPGENIKFKGKELSFEFNVKPFVEKTRPTVTGSTITSATSSWGPGVTSLTGKATSKLNSDIEKPFLSNPMHRTIEINGEKTFEFGRMGFLQKGQSNAFSQSVDILKQRTEKAPELPHFDLRLMNTNANEALLAEHQTTINLANKQREDDGLGEIQTCTVPINQNERNAWTRFQFGLAVMYNSIDAAPNPVAKLAAGIVLGGLGSVLAGIATPFVAFASLFSIDKACVKEWEAATPNIDSQLQKFEKLLETQPENTKAKAIINETRTLLDSISQDLKGNHAPKGTDGLMLSVLLMKSADALGMSVSEGCKSNKDRGTIVDMMIQALEIKNANNQDDTYERLDFTNKTDRHIFKQVVQEAETRHTSANNTGIEGNMFESGDFPSILGFKALRSFVGIGPLGKA
ncbi:hypothetical protein [uncultured Shewanella sp.]|uniref:hypothetical protein n=1 Tax=uncultured Shewanella sp. TaxID=173975 RepID=UPI00262EB6F2|nr:hypothetical protein [uncultured Shewanella sp.]